MKKRSMVVVRGGGDLATGTIAKLYQAGFQVLVTEIENPSCIRRKVAFCEAAFDGKTVVEGMVCEKIDSLDQKEAVWEKGNIPLIIDSEGNMIKKCCPDIVVDAIIAKENTGTTINMAPVTIGLGPGFEAGIDVDAVIETKRGHRLGRILYHGKAIDNTGIPGLIGGYGKERVMHAKASGPMKIVRDIGSIVKKDEVIGYIGETPVLASLDGVLRGIIREDFPVTEGLKIADIDPRMEQVENCDTISDKARCIAGGVLEAILHLEGQKK